MEKAKKITLATVKSFIRKNCDNLYISNLSYFDGMTDGTQYSQDQSFRPVKIDETLNKESDYYAHTQGIRGAWFVGQSRDHFSAFEKDGFRGFHVYNCCGSFNIAVKA